jgi:hypothetical protein
MLTRKVHRFHAVAGLDSLVTRCFDQVPEELHVEFIVLNNHHLLCHVRSHPRPEPAGCPSVSSDVSQYRTKTPALM